MTNEPPSGPDGLAHDGLAHGGQAHDGLAHGGLAHDGLAPAGLALDRAVDRYLRHVAIERGLSVNTVDRKSTRLNSSHSS